MFWKTDEPHGLPHNPFKSCVVPRPIGWISTISNDGIVNLAPYSFFNGVAGEPPMVMFASGAPAPGRQKDSIVNAEATGEFVCSMVSFDLRLPMNETSAGVDPEVDEFDIAGLETEPAELVKPPRVKGAPVHMECLYHQTVELPTDAKGRGNAICIGRVIGIHIADGMMKDGMVDTAAMRPVARLGYMEYTSVTDVFAIDRPGGL